MNKKNLLILLIIVVLIGAINVLSKEERSISTNDNKQVVVVGVPAPLTGARADAGVFAKNGLTLAQEKVNSDPNKRYKIELRYEDTKYEPQVAVSAVKKLIEIDKVNYIIGPYGSSEVMAAGPVAEAQKKIMLVPGAQSDEVSDLGDYVFRLIHHSSQEVPVFGKFMANRMQSDSLHILAINTGITPSYLKNLPSILEENGKKIGLVEKFEATDSDFKTQLTKIKHTNPTDIFLIATPKQTGLILKQANELGVKAQFYGIGVEGPDLVKTAGLLAEGYFYPYSYDSESAEQNVQEFHGEYVKRFNSENDTIAANVYDSLILLSLCLENNGDDVDKIKGCLYQTKDYPGAGGTFSIDQKGDAVKSIIIKTVKDGKLIRQ